MSSRTLPLPSTVTEGVLTDSVVEDHGFPVHSLYAEATGALPISETGECLPAALDQAVTITSESARTSEDSLAADYAGIAAKLVVRPWSDPVVEKHGFPVSSPYVEAGAPADLGPVSDAVSASSGHLGGGGSRRGCGRPAGAGQRSRVGSQARSQRADRANDQAPVLGHHGALAGQRAGGAHGGGAGHREATTTALPRAGRLPPGHGPGRADRQHTRAVASGGPEAVMSGVSESAGWAG